jgi:hypothetical protein
MVKPFVTTLESKQKRKFTVPNGAIKDKRQTLAMGPGRTTIVLTVRILA